MDRKLPRQYEVTEGTEPGSTSYFGRRRDAEREARRLSRKDAYGHGQMARVAVADREVVAVFEGGRRIG